VKVIVPPLKSQGIKTKLVPWILEHVPRVEGRWIEPFFGTGVVGFNANFPRAVFNEINPHIINFYRGIQTGAITPAVVDQYLREEGDKLRSAGNEGYDHYLLVRERFNSSFGSLDFLFLNRAGFNGMMRFSKAGKWNIPFCQKPDRFRAGYRTKIVNQVRAIQSRMCATWEFQNGPFKEVIAEAREEDFIYCDPPYFARHTDYFNRWGDEEEQALYDELQATAAPFILSTWHHSPWRENPSIEKYWNKFRIVTRSHFYHAGAKEKNRNEIVEALVMNFEPRPTSEISCEQGQLELAPV
jgi:DNA adenine methylase